jgi:hypothetical protein
MQATRPVLAQKRALKGNPDGSGYMSFRVLLFNNLHRESTGWFGGNGRSIIAAVMHLPAQSRPNLFGGD